MTRSRKRAFVVASAVVAVVAVALPAWAYYAFTTQSSTSTSVARTLGTPGTGTPSATSTSVSFSVSAPSTGPTPSGYRVDRTAPTASSNVCPSLSSGAGTCTDTSPVPGQTNTYSVYALLGAHWASLSPAPVSVAVPAAASYTLSPATTTPTAGTAFNITITAKVGASTDTAYTGSKTLDWSGAQTIGTFNPTLPATASFSSGVATVSVTLVKAGSQTLTATDHNATGYTGSATVNVNRANVQLSLGCVASAPRNTAVSPTLNRPATDAFGNSTTGAAVTATVNATQATPSSQSVTIAVGATSQSFTLTLANNASSTTVSTNAPSGYTAATNCAINHT